MPRVTHCLGLLLLSAAACTDPKCFDDEVKVGTQCREIRRETDASAQDSSTSSQLDSALDASEPRADATVEAGVDSCSCGPHARCNAGTCECVEGFVGLADNCRATSRRLAATDELCVIRKDGSVWCWGRFDGSAFRAPHVIPGIDDAVELATGGSHACARRAEGSVACWGANGNGQLGNGGNVSSAVPLLVSGLRNTKSIVARGQHTCVVDANDNVKCWGLNPACVLGYCGEPSNVPVTILGLTDVTRVVLGVDHACALRKNGSVMCWGSASGGALGNGIDSMTGNPTPAMVPGIVGATDIAAGTAFSCALTTGINCWGRIRYNDHGTDVIDLDSRQPLPIVSPPIQGWLVAGQWHLCGRSSSTVVCRGNNVSGQLGDGTYTRTPIASSTLPSFVTVRELVDPLEVSADSESTCVLTRDERVLCTGNLDGSNYTNLPIEIAF